MTSRLKTCTFLWSIVVLAATGALYAEPVARIDGGSSYESLAEAFSAAADGDVVELLSDVELTSAFTATGNKTVTLRGGAYTLSSTVAIKPPPPLGEKNVASPIFVTRSVVKVVIVIK